MDSSFVQGPWTRRVLILLGLLAVFGVFYVRLPADFPLPWLAKAFSVPPATAIGWIVDLFGFAFTFAVGVVLISQFALPVHTWDERVQAIWHILDAPFGGKGRVVFVKEGKLIANVPELRRGGAGVILVDSSSAVVLERGARFSRAAGPGIVFLEPRERILTTLDLRKQSRTQPVAALTKDGIEVKTTVGVTFGLAVSAKEPDGDADDAAGAVPVGARLKRMYDFDPRSAFKAIYGTAAGKEAPVGWTELPPAVAAERFRALLARQTLDDLFRPLDPKTFPLQDFNRRLTEDVRDAPILCEAGIHVFGVAVGVFELPLEVQKQRVASWEAEWNRRAQVALASGDVQAEKIKQRARIQAQAEVATVLRAALKPDNEVWTAEDKERIARRIMGALQQLAPHTRRAQVGDVVRVLADLRMLLDVSPGTTGPLLGEGQVESEAGFAPAEAGPTKTSRPEAGPTRSGQAEVGP